MFEWLALPYDGGGQNGDIVIALFWFFVAGIFAGITICQIFKK